MIKQTKPIIKNPCFINFRKPLSLNYINKLRYYSCFWHKYDYIIRVEHADHTMHIENRGWNSIMSGYLVSFLKLW